MLTANHLSKQTRFFLSVLLPWLVLTAIRYNLQAHMGETYLVHSTIADSILQGNKWGLHALVQLMDIPLIPTLALACSKLLAIPLGLHPATLLASMSQAALLILLVRAIPRDRRLPRYALAAIAFLPAIPFFRNLLLIDDPNWISAIPLVLVLLTMEDYRHQPSLRATISMAVNLSILVFCGPTLLACAIILLIVLTFNLNQKSEPGTLFILWLPFIYALLLWMPWDLNPKENFLLDFFRQLSQASRPSYRLPFDWHPFLVAMVACLILALKTRDNITARCLLPLFAVIPCLAAASNAANIAIPASEVAIIVTVSVLIINAFNQTDDQAKTPQTAALLALAILILVGFRHSQVNFQHRSMPLLVLKEAYRLLEPPLDLFDSRDAPDAQTLISLANRQWKGSRIIVPGQRLAEKVYHEPSQKHFRPLLDFTPRTFKKLAETEQFHLIVPPADGRFYGHRSHLAKIHAQGASYLQLVAQLDHGWQLWRSLPPRSQTQLPAEESL